MKQLLAGQVLAAFDDASKTSVSNLNVVILVAFATKVEAQCFTMDFGVAIAESGQAE